MTAPSRPWKASERTYNQARTTLVVVAVLAIALAIAAAVWLIRSITAPLARAVEVADRVAGGDLTTHIDVDSRDETGQLLSALQRMQQSLVRTVSVVRQTRKAWPRPRPRLPRATTT